MKHLLTTADLSYPDALSVLDTADHLEERADELSSDGTITVADRGTIVLRKVS